MNQTQEQTPRLLHHLWWLALALAIVILLLSLPGYHLTTNLPGTGAELAWRRVSAWVSIVFSLGAAVLSLALALLLYRKKRNEVMGLFLAYYFLIYAVFICGPMESALEYWMPQYPYLGALIQSTFFLLPGLALILVFPNGHFVPRWSRIIIYISALLVLLTLLLEHEELVKLNTLRAQILSGILYCLIIIALGVQVYRYRVFYTPLERQQTKWVTYGSLVYLILLATLAVPYYYILNTPPERQPIWLGPLITPAWWLALSIFPISLTIAILRARLWDIDLIIRRTVTYALITATLALAFFGSVVVLQQLFSFVSDSRQNGLITVLSTLAIAALFVPLRNRVQNLIDQRFYRRKYDARRVFSAYAETVRDETDLEKLTERLIRVVDETMQPQSVSIWLQRDTMNKDR